MNETFLNTFREAVKEECPNFNNGRCLAKNEGMQCNYLSGGIMECGHFTGHILPGLFKKKQSIKNPRKFKIPLTKDTNVIVFDLETSRQSPETGEIIELAANKYYNRCRKGTIWLTLSPKKKVSAETFRITGLTPEELKYGSNPKKSIQSFIGFIGGKTSILVAHNAHFDLGFLREFTRKHHILFGEHKIIDTFELANYLYPHASAHLSDLATMFGLKFDRTHRALSDVELTTQVLWKLEDEYYKRFPKKPRIRIAKAKCN